MHPCDEKGVFLPLGMLPIPPLPKSNEDWLLFGSRAGFELAELLYKRAGLSQSNVDQLLNIWSATLAPHDDEPPIIGHRDLHVQIDGIDFGFIPWESSTIKYQGHRPENSAAPSWMDQEYKLWYHDPRKAIHNILTNQDFNTVLNYIPYRDTCDGKRHYCDFMSGDWGWNQCVRNIGWVHTTFTYHFFRISSHQTHTCMDVCLFR